MKRIVTAGFAMLVHLAVCDETTEVYGRLAAHSNLWATSKLDYKHIVNRDLMPLKKTDATKRGVEMWVSDLLRYPDGSIPGDMSSSIQYKDAMLWMALATGLCDMSNIGMDVSDYVGRLRDIEEYAAPLVAATNAVLMNTMGLRASTDVETLQCAAQDIRVDMLPYLRQYWLSQPFDARSSCRSNIVERARLNEAEQQTVFSEP